MRNALKSAVGFGGLVLALATFMKLAAADPKIIDYTKPSPSYVLVTNDDAETLKQTAIQNEERLRGEWNVSTETSPIDDSTNVFLNVKSNELLPGKYGGTTRFTLWVRCMENQTAILIHFGGYFMASSPYHDWGSLTYRVDRRKAVTFRWHETTDHNYLMISGGDAIRVLRDWADGDTLLIRATPFSESPKTATFPIKGLRQALKPLMAACNWRLNGTSGSKAGIKQKQELSAFDRSLKAYRDCERRHPFLALIVCQGEFQAMQRAVFK